VLGADIIALHNPCGLTPSWVASLYNRAGGAGAGDIVPAGKGTARHLIEAYIARGVVAGPVAGEVTNANHAVSGGRTADILPVHKRAVADLIETAGWVRRPRRTTLTKKIKI
jgi:hypothetical protein